VSWTLNPGAADAAYQRASDAGIPIVGMGSTSKYFFSSVWDPSGVDCRMTKDGAAFIAKRVPGAKVLVIGGPPVPALEFYINCFIKDAKAAGLNVVERQNNVKDQAASAQSIVQDMLTKHPDANAIFSYNDASALGAAAVVRASGKQAWVEGKQEGIIIMSNGGQPPALNAIKAGAMTAAYDVSPEQLGRISVQLLAQKIKGRKVPKRVVGPFKLWTAKNAGQYVSNLKRPIKLTPLVGS
jgi:ribose transport system substrate-binding protein